jgi:BTB/POZ domain
MLTHDHRHGDSIITINVRKANSTATHKIQKYLICHYSPFFNSAFNRPTHQGQIEAMTFNDMDPEAFSLFLHWLHRQNINDTYHNDARALIEVWLLARTLRIPRLQNCAAKALYDGVEDDFTPSVANAQVAGVRCGGSWLLHMYTSRRIRNSRGRAMI